MNPLVIACSILKEEIESIIARYGLADALDVIWMPESLHNVPDRLKAALQEQIDDVDSARPEILLAYGNCGNALVGLETREVPLVMPRLADCISILLFGYDDLDELRKHTIFQTRGMLDGEQGLEAQYKTLVERKGEKRACWIIEEMYKHYDELLLIDTGVCNLAPQLERVRHIGELYHLKPALREGNVGILERLLTGDTQSPDFIHVAPHEKIKLVDFFTELAANRC